MKVVISSVLLLFAGNAFAGWRDQCSADIKKHCAEHASAGALELYSCLNESSSSLDYECRTSLQQTVDVLKTAERDCQEDVHKFCETVSPGAGGWLRCLRVKGEAVSLFCRQEMAKVEAAGL